MGEITLKKGLIFLLFVTLSLVNAFALENSNSGKKFNFKYMYHKGYKLMERGEYNKALEVFQKGLKEASKKHNQQVRMVFLNAIGECYFNANNFEKALPSFKEAYSIALNLDLKNFIPDIAFEIAKTYEKLQEIDNALFYYQKTLQWAKDSSLIQDIHTKIAKLYVMKKKYKEGEEHYKKAIEIAIKRKDATSQSLIMGDLAFLYTSMGNFKKAEETYKQAISIAQSCKDMEVTSLYLGSLATLYTSENKYKEAEKTYKKAYEIAKKIHNCKMEVLWLKALSHLYTSLGRFKEALFIYKKLYKYPNIPNSSFYASILSSIGELYYKSGNFKEAIASYKKALTIYRQAKDIKGEIETLESISLVYSSTGDNVKAKNEIEKAITLAQKTNDKKIISRLFISASFIYASLGNFDKAIDYAQKGIELHEKGISKDTILMYSSISSFFSHIGRYYKALQYNMKALDIALKIKDYEQIYNCLSTNLLIYVHMGNLIRAYEESKRIKKIIKYVKNPLLKIDFYQNMGFFYMYIGDPEKALHFLKKAWSESKKIGVTSAQISSLMGLSKAYILTGKYSTAQKHLKTLLNFSKEYGNKRAMYETYETIGWAYLKQKKYKKAIKYFKTTLKYAKVRKDYSRTLEMLEYIFVAYSSMGKVQTSLRYLKEALNIAKKRKDISSTMSIEGLLGLSYYKQGNFEKALFHLKEAVNICERRRENIKIGELKLEFMSFQRGKLSHFPDWYEALVEILVLQKKYKQAFEYAERGKARTFLDAIGNPQITTDSKLKNLVKLQEKTLNEIRILRVKIPSLPREERQRAYKELSKKEKEYQRISQKIEILNPQYALIKSVKISSIKTIQNSLKENEALIEYYSTSQELFIWTITKNQFHFSKVSIPQKNIHTQVKKIRRLIVHHQNGTDEEMKLLKKNLHNMYKTLISPTEKYTLYKAHLIIIPHSSLHYLPFSALLDEKGKYLIQKKSIIFMPSASSVPLIRRQNKKINPLFVGFALGEGSQNIPFSPLPNTTKEVKEIASCFQKKGIKTKIFINKDFTVKNVLNNVKKAGYIHFATHGILTNRGKGQFSSLVTSDGLIFVTDILKWRINSKIVVLSACQTGLGKITKADDIISLSIAFLQAGAENLLATLWSIDDESTKHFMTCFYKNLIESIPPRDAMTKAVRKQIKKYPHPFHWASFVLYGIGY